MMVAEIVSDLPNIEQHSTRQRLLDSFKFLLMQFVQTVLCICFVFAAQSINVVILLIISTIFVQ